MSTKARERHTASRASAHQCLSVVIAEHRERIAESRRALNNGPVTHRLLHTRLHAHPLDCSR